MNAGNRVQSLEYNLERIMRHLYNEFSSGRVEKSKLVSLEIQYLKVIHSPKLLNAELSESPEFFADLIKTAYFPHS